MFSIDRDLKHLHHIPTLSLTSHMHTYTQTHTHKHIHTHKHTQIHAQCTHARTHARTHAHTCIHNAHTHAHTDTHAHTHTHTHAHTHHVLPTGLWLRPPAGLCHLGHHGLQLRDEVGTRSLHGAGEVPRLPEGVPRPHLWHQGGHG